MHRNCVIILGNHGVTVTGDSLNDVLLKTISLDFLCRSVVTARAAGMKLSYLPEKVRKDFAVYSKGLKNA